MNPQTAAYLAEFRAKGIVVMPGKFAGLADYLEREYFSYLEKRTSTRPLHFVDTIDLGERATFNGTLNGMTSFRDPTLASYLFDPELSALVYNAYGRQPYYRELPRIIVNAVPETARPELDVSTKFHLDYYRQMSFMLLVNDVDEEGTCLEYATGSHLERGKGWDRYGYKDEEIQERYPVVRAHGPKGTLILFEGGSGYHRARFVPGTVRKTVQTTFTTGHQMMLDDERVDTAADVPGFEGYPRYVRRMMNRMLVRGWERRLLKRGSRERQLAAERRDRGAV